ncbi:division/cell wall cluster transcriptional repressor MraZ [Tsuneonella amylolytica]|uniref:division/cell wall cluster transcriptional repressor MraZ n=1 Tax=Tsuneonella amylolytica TaxID=2338327 RepID=UPI0013C3F9FC|nr:division/cell wall cluster transcriptional repressor MraZ [Tsuneonella amylolytica]
MASAPFNGFSGQAFSPAGDKGRFVLPPLFRKAVKASSDGDKILCLDKHARFDCLVGFGLSRMDELEAQLDREEQRGGDEFDRDVRAQQLFGFTQVSFDDSGRFVLPDHLRQLGHIEDAMFFQGGGRQFTIWNPAELMRMDDAWAAAKAACTQFLAEGKAK